MARIALVTVPDEGAAEMVRAALVDAGIQPEFERVYLDHPYRASALAEPWRIFVPAERLIDAQNALARLEHDMIHEVEAQAMAWQGDVAGEGRSSEVPLPASRWRRSRPLVLWMLALTALLPFLVICLYARRETEPGSALPRLTRPHHMPLPSILRLLRHRP